MKQYVVIECRAWMNEGGYGFNYSMPTAPLDSLDAAISEGFKVTGSDDFNVGVIANGRLTDLLWMRESLGEPSEVLADIATQIGVRA